MIIQLHGPQAEVQAAVSRIEETGLVLTNRSAWQTTDGTQLLQATLATAAQP